MTKKLKNIDNGNGIYQLQTSGEDDRLSSLPDSLLISILSFLPISSAVTTSVLSHRWHHLWTYLTHIFFSFHRDRFPELQNYVTAINHVISKLTSPKIHTFDIELPFYGQELACSALLVPTFEEIFLRNPEIIKIGVNTYRCLYHMPTTLFKTQYLVELKLNSNFKFDFPSDTQIVINLPRLKRLHLILYDSHRPLMHTLFKSCPLLEDLYLNMKLKEDGHVDIVAPNLKFLTTLSLIKNTILLIDASKLVNLKTEGFAISVFYHFVKNLRNLQEARISIPKYHGDRNDYISRILALFQGIFCARFVSFDGCLHDNLKDVALPSFSNLIDLSIHGSDMDSSSWMPSCLLCNVKSLRIFNLKPNDYVIRVLGDILSNAPVLEQLHVSHSNYIGDKELKTRMWEEYEFAMKLFKLPRSSPNCRIELCGVFTGSCEDFQHGQLGFKFKTLDTYHH